MNTIADIVPQLCLRDESRIGVGFDVATTENATSNPSSVALVEQMGRVYMARLIIRWKTADPEIAHGILQTLLMRIAPRRARKLCVDASNEKYFAAEVKRRLAGVVTVQPVSSGESIEHLGEKMTHKSYLGNLLINAMEDGLLGIPNEVWIRDDFRLVKRERGSFSADVDAEGNHADTFDAVKLALFALDSKNSGVVAATAAAVGAFGNSSPKRTGIRNPFASKFETKSNRINV